MQMQTLIVTFLSQLLEYLPGFILNIVGITLSLYFYKKNTKKFLLTAIAFAIFFLNSLVGFFLKIWITTQATQNGLSAIQIASSYQLSSCLFTLVWLIAWIFLLIAIFRPKFNTTENETTEATNETSNLN